MMHIFVAMILIGVCGILGLLAYSLYRKDHAELQKKRFSNEELYVEGARSARLKSHLTNTFFAHRLHEAGVTTAPLLWLVQMVSVMIILGLLCIVFSGEFIGGLVIVLAGSCLVGLWLAIKRSKRSQLLESQFVRFVPQVATNVRSSLTLERAFKSAANHADSPLKDELALVLADAAYGVSLADAFEGMAQRNKSSDIKSLAAAVRIQQRFGGAIAPVLEMIAQHAQMRLKANRELKTELAGTQIAKWFVAAAMPVIFSMMYLSNKDFAQFYQEDPLGWVMLGIALVLEIVGLIACQQITKIHR